MTAIDRFFQLGHLAESAQPWAWTRSDDAACCWRALASEIHAWLTHHRIEVRDALVILPVGAVLPLARQGWAEAVGQWMPRIDTVAALMDSVGWMASPPAGRRSDLPPVTLDAVVDRLQAASLLGREEWGKTWARRDRRGFEFALDQVVQVAQTLVRRMQALPPPQREAYVAHARGVMGAGAPSGPGGRERLLLAWSLEWAASTALDGLPSDALFEVRPSALVVVTAGDAVSPGTEGHLSLSLMAHLAEQGVPVRWFSARAVPGPATEDPNLLAPALRACADAEDEARQAAAQVMDAVNAARRLPEGDSPWPVALLATDRSLVRRVRAMLDGAGLKVADETGWLLSTTRAGAVIMRLLQAAAPRASTDDLLDWLKSGWIQWATDDEPARDADQGRALAELERWCRRHGMLGAWGLQLPEPVEVDDASVQPDAADLPQLVPEGRQALPGMSQRFWRWAQQAVQALQTRWSGRPLPLGEWLQALQTSLQACGAWSALQQDPAGELALRALRFDSMAEEGAWKGLTHQTRLDGPSFQRWVASVLEATTFRPAPPQEQVDVVITPMARATLRPFHALVLPGADERQLGALASVSGWLSARLCEALDLSTPQSQRAAQWDAFSLLMTRPRVVCLHRRAQGSEPLEASAWLERWAALEGTPLCAQADACETITVDRAATRPPSPSLGDDAWALPKQLTATAYESLRQCPYRFFALHVLGLRDQDELEEGLDRSDFGIWLHEVLRTFHDRRSSRLMLSSAAEDVEDWLDAAQEVTRRQGFDRDSVRPYFLPFQADLGRLAHAYVKWLRPHEDAGWTLQASEHETHLDLDVAEGLGVQLIGVLDRVDSRHQEGARISLVLDYKTGSLDGLRRKIASPLEDTQLAFYAALSGQDSAIQAAYLHLDAGGVTQLDHQDVQESARVLLEGIAADWQRLHEGAPLLALGEGLACSHCQARGLCRKDHWSQEEQA